METANLSRMHFSATAETVQLVSDIQDDKCNDTDGDISMQVKLWKLICFSRAYRWGGETAGKTKGFKRCSTALYMLRAKYGGATAYVSSIKTFQLNLS